MKRVRPWRAPDGHTGVGIVGGVPYTYNHAGHVPVARAAVYRVECYADYAPPAPAHRNVYYVPGTGLNEFLADWLHTGEIVVDIRPLTRAQADEEVRAFRERLPQTP
jgi:hypothetical protein